MLNVKTVLTRTQTVTICNSQLPYSWNGNTITTAGTYLDTLTTQAGCDSIITLVLNVNPVLTSTQTVTICNSQLPYSWNGNTITSSGTYLDKLTTLVR